MKAFTQRIGVDFGETRVRIWVDGKDEYVVATHASLFPLFLQEQARQRLWSGKKTDTQFAAIYSHGVVIDPVRLGAYVTFLCRTAGAMHHPLQSLHLTLVLSARTPPSTKEIWVQLLHDIGVSKITFLSAPIAACVGAGFAFPLSTYVVGMHLGWTESTIFGCSLIHLDRLADLFLSGAYVKSQFGAYVSQTSQREQTQEYWEQLPTEIGRCLAGEMSESASPASRREGELINGILDQTVAAIQIFLSDLSADQLSLTTKQGIVVVGGLAHTPGLCPALSRRVGLPVYPVPEPDLALIRGVQQIARSQELENE